MEKDIIVDKTEKIIINKDRLFSRDDFAPFKKFIIEFYHKIYSYEEGALIVEKEYGNQLIIPYIGCFFWDGYPPKVEVYPWSIAPYDFKWDQVKNTKKRIVIFCQLLNKEGYAEYTHKIMPAKEFNSGFPEGMLCDVLFIDVPYYAFLASVDFLGIEICNYLEFCAQPKEKIPIDFAVGDKIVCECYGEGEIMSVDYINKVYWIKFEKNGELGIGFKSAIRMIRLR